MMTVRVHTVGSTLPRSMHALTVSGINDERMIGAIVHVDDNYQSSKNGIT
jgi:hypothetical protein